MKANGETEDLILPKPGFHDGKPVWYSIVRVSRTVPWGYREDPEDIQILLPIEEELELLEVAKEYLQTHSYRQVAQWLSEESGRYISHVGLRKRVHQERKRSAEASRAAILRKKYEQALRKEERLSKKRVGSPQTYAKPKDYSFVKAYLERKEREDPGPAEA